MAKTWLFVPFFVVAVVMLSLLWGVLVVGMGGLAMASGTS